MLFTGDLDVVFLYKTSLEYYNESIKLPKPILNPFVEGGLIE